MSEPYSKATCPIVAIVDWGEILNAVSLCITSPENFSVFSLPKTFAVAIGAEAILRIIDPFATSTISSAMEYPVASETVSLNHPESLKITF